MADNSLVAFIAVCVLAFGMVGYLCRLHPGRPLAAMPLQVAPVFATMLLRATPVLAAMLLRVAPVLAATLLAAAGTAGAEQHNPTVNMDKTTPYTNETAASGKHETAVFGAGCFWCVEPAFEMRKGVLSAESGYMGGSTANPTYQQVCTGQTGHVEVVKVVFDPAVISYAELVDWFFQLHDPTTLNRQGADVGTQYRSVIFTYGERQRTEALAGRERAQAAHADRIVTTVEPAQPYYKAEGYHQDYFSNNPEQAYCSIVIAPKLQKLKAKKPD